MCAHSHRANPNAPTAVTHVAPAPPMAPGHGQQKCPVATTGASRHHSSTALTTYVYAAVHAIVIKDSSGIQQNAVNKQISNSRKSNLNVLFKVRIFELRLTSLIKTLQIHLLMIIALCALMQTVRCTTAPSSGWLFYMNRRPSYPGSRGMLT